MLIEFSVANFRSLRDRQTFSLVKAKGDELVETNTFTKKAFNEFNLLRSSAIYGPNAGGKSNLLLAMRAMQEIVLDSATQLKRGDEISVEPFRLSPKTASSPSEFEVVFISDEVRYQYGFSATEERVVEEWLLAYPNGRPQRWFSRQWDEKSQDYRWELGNNLTGEKQLWLKSTRNNALFLSTAVHLNSAQLQTIYDWFNVTLRLTDTNGWGNEYSASLCRTEDKSLIMDFLNAADLGIDDIKVIEKTFDQDILPDELPEGLKSIIADKLKHRQFLDVKTIHRDSMGQEVKFDLEEESDGTKKLFSFAGPWIDSLNNGYILFIDELHDNLHPRLVKFLVQLFHNSETNPKNAQLVFTTHETSILNQEIFRRDQIWFCEKDDRQATSIYPLSDFSPRKGRENLELAYLSGRYGALPYIRPLKRQA